MPRFGVLAVDRQLAILSGGQVHEVEVAAGLIHREAPILAHAEEQKTSVGRHPGQHDAQTCVFCCQHGLQRTPLVRFDIVGNPEQVVLDLVVSRRRNGVAVVPQNRCTAEVQVLAVRRPGGVGLEPIPVGQFRRRPGPLALDLVADQRRVQVRHVPNLHRPGTEELADLVDRIDRQPPARMPGGIAPFAADLLNLPVPGQQRVAAVGTASQTDAHRAGVVAHETVAVQTTLGE